MIDLKYSHTDTGFCRVYYKEIAKPHRLYCIQDEGSYFVMYRCSKDWEEPDYEVKMQLFNIPEIPNPHDVMEKQINQLLKGLSECHAPT